MAIGALVPSHMPSNPYALPGGSMAMGGPPNVQPPPLMAGPPPQPQIGYGAAPTGGAMNPFGAPDNDDGSTAGELRSPPRPALAMDPFAPTPAAPSDPWSSMPPAMLAADPWGGEPTSSSSALVPSTAVNNDPFGIFGAASPAVPPQQQPPPPQQQHQQQQQQPPFYHASPPPPQQQQQQAPPNDDPWADLGFGSAPAPPSAPAPASTSSEPFFLQDEGDLFDGGTGAAAARAQREASAAPTPSKTTPKPSSTPSKTHAESRNKSDLPPGGEWYDAKIFTPTLGVMFFKPKELIDSLFLQTDKSTVEALRDRPVVAFIVEGSSARSAGVELGHVLLKVNGIDVKNPKEASRLIKEGPRPLPLLFYVPDTKVVVAEGEHMVKYNTKETSAPNSAKDWKPKYVVIGGIIAQPWMMNMYRSKSEYDIAVIETQARRPISVKVKQFSLQGARIQNDWQGPQMVKYKNKLHPWKYIVVLPVSRNPIKIASPNLSQLKPVHEGIRRVLTAQQSRSGVGVLVGMFRCSRFRGIRIVVVKDVERMSIMGEGMVVVEEVQEEVGTMVGMVGFENG
ncbi:LOW QUALITY PROTEIN: hypothetical protein HJC23_001274 [Cyclotella cryptica]|uniref:PDZ domain-containing protein n=1 Tax=Cyclotella cryptica TaxID=29204 RepID=A0ABD3PEM9_9STRA